MEWISLFLIQPLTENKKTKFSKFLFDIKDKTIVQRCGWLD
jgi:hypothetical protein